MTNPVLAPLNENEIIITGGRRHDQSTDDYCLEAVKFDVQENTITELGQIDQELDCYNFQKSDFYNRLICLIRNEHYVEQITSISLDDYKTQTIFTFPEEDFGDYDSELSENDADAD